MKLRLGTLGTLLGLFVCVSCSGNPEVNPGSTAPHCDQTISQYCGSTCLTFDDTAGLCAAGVSSTAECGSYRVATAHGVDTGTDYYFAADGSLVAVVAYNANSHATHCLAGPDGFAVPASCSQATPVCVAVPLTCSQTPTALCAGGTCPTFNDPASLCASNITMTEDCGGYHVGIDQGVDTQSRYYFATDGSLVAVVHENANSHTTTCEAGPAGFTEPDCTGAQTTPVCVVDGGAD